MVVYLQIQVDSTGQYQNSENEAWVFSPNNPGEFVQLDFTMVNVETCCDNIAVYNGPDATFPVLNADLENPGNIYINGSFRNVICNFYI